MYSAFLVQKTSNNLANQTADTGHQLFHEYRFTSDVSSSALDWAHPVLEALCQVLLRRYGVVFREVLMRESNLPNWREILLTLRWLEDRGEVRGGRFVPGFLGEQFALPAAVESLRSTRAEPPTGETITISAADPLNLVGIVLPGAKVLAISSRFVTYRDGVALESSQPIDYATIAQAG